jgi:hypothetical protein
MSERPHGLHRESLVILVLIGLFFALNLPSVNRYPCVWIDEVSYADPGINLATGHGWTSRCWYAQSSSEFWAGNVPAHPFLVACATKAFGVSLLTVRVVNYVLAALTMLLLWIGVARTGLIRSVWARALLFLLVAGGYGIVFSYRSGRPDCITMLLTAAGLVALSVRRTGIRVGSLFLVCFLSPWAGLQMLPLLACCCMLLLLIGIRRNFPVAATIVLGTTLGLAALLVFYHANGVLDAFLKSTVKYTAGNSGGLLGSIARGTFNHHNVIPKDFSYAVLLVGAVGMMVMDRLRRRPASKPVLLAIIFNLLVTATLLLSGEFPTYYGWMTFIPMAVAACMWLEQPGRRKPEFALGLAACAGSIVIGIGMHLAAGAWNWHERNYRIVQDVVDSGVGHDDVVFADSSAYYALLGQNEFYTDFHLSAFTQAQRARVTTIVIDPADFQWVSASLGGGFEPQDAGFTPSRRGFLGYPLNLGFLTEYNYSLRVYRRTAHPVPIAAIPDGKPD